MPATRSISTAPAIRAAIAPYDHLSRDPDRRRADPSLTETLPTSHLHLRWPSTPSLIPPPRYAEEKVEEHEDSAAGRERLKAARRGSIARRALPKEQYVADRKGMTNLVVDVGSVTDRFGLRPAMSSGASTAHSPEIMRQSHPLQGGEDFSFASFVRCLDKHLADDPFALGSAGDPESHLFIPPPEPVNAVAPVVYADRYVAARPFSSALQTSSFLSNPSLSYPTMPVSAAPLTPHTAYRQAGATLSPGTSHAPGDISALTELVDALADIGVVTSKSPLNKVTLDELIRGLESRAAAHGPSNPSAHFSSISSSAPQTQPNNHITNAVEKVIRSGLPLEALYLLRRSGSSLLHTVPVSSQVSEREGAGGRGAGGRGAGSGALGRMTFKTESD